MSTYNKKEKLNILEFLLLSILILMIAQALFVHFGKSSSNLSDRTKTYNNTDYQKNNSSKEFENEIQLKGTYSDWYNYVSISDYVRNNSINVDVTNITSQRIKKVTVHIRYLSYGVGPNVGQGTPDWYWRDDVEEIFSIAGGSTKTADVWMGNKELGDYEVTSVEVSF